MSVEIITKKKLKCRRSKIYRLTELPSVEII